MSYSQPSKHFKNEDALLRHDGPEESGGNTLACVAGCHKRKHPEREADDAQTGATHKRPEGNKPDGFKPHALPVRKGSAVAKRFGVSGAQPLVAGAMLVALVLFPDFVIEAVACEDGKCVRQRESEAQKNKRTKQLYAQHHALCSG